MLKELSRQYVLYVEPTAGVMYRHTWLRAFSHLPGPVVFGVAGKEDTLFIQSQPDIITTELAHADYLLDVIDFHTDNKKEYDLVFIGTFDEMRRKRHKSFLGLLKHPGLAHATAMVIGLRSSRSRLGRQQWPINTPKLKFELLGSITYYLLPST